MAIQLDPFHMLRAINCPEPGPVVTDWITMGVIRETESLNGFTTRTLCSGDDKTVGGIGIGYYQYRNPFTWNELTAPFYNCDQLLFTMRGQTSGYVHTIDNRGKAFLGYTNCVWQDCYLSTGNGMVRFLPYTFFFGGAFGGNPQYTEYVTVANRLGFTNNESVEIQFTAPPTFDVQAITEKSAGRIWVETTTNSSLYAGAGLTLAETGIYDGNYEVVSVSGDKIELHTTYLSDVFTGMVTPKYDCFPGDCIAP